MKLPFPDLLQAFMGLLTRRLVPTNESLSATLDMKSDGILKIFIVPLSGQGEATNWPIYVTLQ